MCGPTSDFVPYIQLSNWLEIKRNHDEEKQKLKDDAVKKHLNDITILNQHARESGKRK